MLNLNIMVSFQKALWDIDVGTKIDKDEGDVAVVGKRLSLYIFGSVRISVYLYIVLYTCTLYCTPIHCQDISILLTLIANVFCLSVVPDVESDPKTRRSFQQIRFRLVFFLEFSSTSIAVMENIGTFLIYLVR